VDGSRARCWYRILYRDMIPGFSILLLTLIIDLWTDYRLFLAAKDVKHKRGAWLRLPALGASVVFLSLHHPWWFWIITTGLVGSVFVTAFDGTWNLLRRDDFFKTHNKGVWDAFWYRLGVIPSALIKLTTIVLSVSLYIKYV
jgi:hypothetical protein